MNKPQKIFLSGPISTRLDTYKGEFDRAAQIVADAGHIPLNPAWMPLGLQQRDYMRISMAMLDSADLLVAHPDWAESAGATIEHNYAERVGIPVMSWADFLAEIQPTPAPEPERPASRVERMFGKRETWGQGTPAQEETGPEAAFERRAVRGFLIVECEDCHETREFCSRSPITYNRCRKCGHDTPLDFTAMRPAYARCKCGREFKYQTNATADTLSINCIACGAPIDLQLNGRGTAYVTFRDAGGGASDEALLP